MSSTQQTMQGDFNIDLSGFDLSDFMQSAVDPTQSMYHPHQQQQPQQPQQQQQHGSARASNGNSSNAINSNPQDHLKQFATPPQHVPMGDPAFSHSSMEPHRQQQHPSTMSHFPRGSGTAVTAESLKVQLQQQMRLQQLQQLQNQILQQQVSKYTSAPLSEHPGARNSTQSTSLAFVTTRTDTLHLSHCRSS